MQYQRMVKTLSETVETFLKCRLHILGGIKREELPVDQFDSALFAEANSALHLNFMKLTKKFIEDLDDDITANTMVFAPKKSTYHQQVI
jgi:flagellar biosynthesis protein FlhG